MMVIVLSLRSVKEVKIGTFIASNIEVFGPL